MKIVIKIVCASLLIAVGGLCPLTAVPAGSSGMATEARVADASLPVSQVSTAAIAAKPVIEQPIAIPPVTGPVSSEIPAVIGAAGNTLETMRYDKFDITLQQTSGTGYNWYWITSAGRKERDVALVDVKRIGGSSTTSVGSPARIVYTFKALRATAADVNDANHTTPILFLYARIDNTGLASGAKIERYNVTIKEAKRKGGRGGKKKRGKVITTTTKNAGTAEVTVTPATVSVK